MNHSFSVGDIVEITFPSDWWEGYWKITAIYADTQLWGPLVTVSQGSKESWVSPGNLRLIYG